MIIVTAGALIMVAVKCEGGGRRGKGGGRGGGRGGSKIGGEEGGRIGGRGERGG